MSHVNDPPSSILDTMTTDDMPASLRELVGYVGIKIAIKLVKTFGGRGVYVPTNPTDQHVICTTLLTAEAKLLADAYGGEQINVPSCATYIKKKRDRRIVSLRNSGKTIGWLSEQFNLSERAIFEITRQK